MPEVTTHVVSHVSTVSSCHNCSNLRLILIILHLIVHLRPLLSESSTHSLIMQMKVIVLLKFHLVWLHLSRTLWHSWRLSTGVTEMTGLDTHCDNVTPSFLAHFNGHDIIAVIDEGAEVNVIDETVAHNLHLKVGLSTCVLSWLSTILNRREYFYKQFHLICWIAACVTWLPENMICIFILLIILYIWRFV